MESQQHCVALCLGRDARWCQKTSAERTLRDLFIKWPDVAAVQNGLIFLIYPTRFFFYSFINFSQCESEIIDSFFYFVSASS